jgi:hypothetical protein
MAANTMQLFIRNEKVEFIAAVRPLIRHATHSIKSSMIVHP